MANTNVIPGAVAGASALFGGPKEAMSAGVGVPTSKPQEAFQGERPDVMGALMDQLTKAQVSPELWNRAITPVPTGHALSMPASMTTPIAPYQMAPMNRQPVVGAGNARARGIGNAITGITNAIGAVVTAKAQKDQRNVAQSTERLLNAQKAIDQANMYLKSGQFKPDSPEFKQLQDSIQKNTQVRDDILSDDKTRKLVEKGFNISFTDPSKNKTMEHAGVQDGIKSFGEQFAAKMPTEVGPNVMAQQQLQVAMQQQQLNQNTLKTLMTYVTAGRKLDQQWDLAHFKEQQQNARAQAQLDQRWDMQTRQFNFAAKMQQNKYSKEFELASYKSNLALNASKDLFNFKTDSEAFQKWQTSNTAHSAAIRELSDGIRKIENDMQLNAAQIAKDPNLKKDYETQLQLLKEQQSLHIAQQAADRKVMQSFAPSLIPDTPEEEEAQNPMNNIETFTEADQLKSYDEATGHAITAF